MQSGTAPIQIRYAATSSQVMSTPSEAPIAIAPGDEARSVVAFIAPGRPWINSRNRATADFLTHSVMLNPASAARLFPAGVASQENSLARVSRPPTALWISLWPTCLQSIPECLMKRHSEMDARPELPSAIERAEFQGMNLGRLKFALLRGRARFLADSTPAPQSATAGVFVLEHRSWDTKED